jgi:hypothetical protein
MDPNRQRSRHTLLQRLRADLRSDPRKRTILIVLLPALLIAWIPLLAGGDTPRPATLPVGETDLSTEVELVQAVIDGEHRARLADLVDRLERPWTPSWSRDEASSPFARLSDRTRMQEAGQREPIREADEEQALAASLEPTSTFLSETHGNVAIIDGRPYRRGDEIEHFVVEEIGDRSVTLRGRFGEYELQLQLGSEGRP